MKKRKSVADRLREQGHGRTALSSEDGYPGDHILPIAPEPAARQERGDAWEPPPAGDPAADDHSYRLAAVDSATFFSTNYSLEWMVKRLLVRGQPAVFGGPKKALKTSTLIDLAVSLASATPFLGHFDVYRRRRVALISGESGEAVIQDAARRVCSARGIDPAALDVHWSFRLPRLASVLDRDRLSAGLKEVGAEVAIIDPLYLCLLAGSDARGLEAGNMFDMGPLLSAAARACLEAGATPIIAHHAADGKSRARGEEPMELGDLAFAGIQEFARQWVLLSRREPFDPETGSSRLWLAAGGSGGQSGVWAVDVEEGVLRDDFTGRRWQVAVHTAGAARSSVTDAREEAKARKLADDVKRDGTQILAALDRLAGADGAAGATEVRAAACLSGDRMRRAMLALIHEGVVESTTVEVATGTGHKVRRPVQGLRRRRRTDGTDGTEFRADRTVPTVSERPTE